MKSPYGAWIGKNEIIPVIKEEEHWEEGMNYLNRRFHAVTTRKYSVYMIMFRLGFVRVVFKQTGEVSSTEFWYKARLSRYQKDYIDATDCNYPIPLTKMYS